MEDLVIEKLSTVYDPEVPVNIWELGLVYGIEFPKQNEVIVTMTLTAPGCPIADQIVQAILDGDVAQCDYRVAVTDSLGNGFILMKGNEDLCQSINAIIAQLMQSGWLNECYEAEMVKASERGII